MVVSTKWSRSKTFSATGKDQNQEIVKEAKASKKTKKGLKASKINKFLASNKHFAGCYAQDEIKFLSIQSRCVSFLVNFDERSQRGSHWVALRITRKKIEVFDPLGFNSKVWPKIPFHLLVFLKTLSYHRKIIFNRQIQSVKSSLCGYFCLYFIMARNRFSFQIICSSFSSDLLKNDFILIYLLRSIQ